MSVLSLSPFIVDFLPELRGELRDFLDPMARIRLGRTCKTLHAEDPDYRPQALPFFTVLQNDLAGKGGYARGSPFMTSFLSQWMGMAGTPWFTWLQTVPCITVANHREISYASAHMYASGNVVGHGDAKMYNVHLSISDSKYTIEIIVRELANTSVRKWEIHIPGLNWQTHIYDSLAEAFALIGTDVSKYFIGL
jgi:hypothetical protein